MTGFGGYSGLSVKNTGGISLTVDFTVDDTNPPPNTPVTFTATGSVGVGYIHVWDFGDGGDLGIAEDTATINHTYTTQEVVSVELWVIRVSDDAIGNRFRENYIDIEAVFSYILDTYTGGTLGLSLRKQRVLYSGALVEIRRSSDNATKDFFPDSNNALSLNSEDGSGTTLSSWIGSDDGFVRTWYDQSGNGYDAQQTTASAQPQIISSGSLITVDSKPTIYFDGTKHLVCNSFELIVDRILTASVQSVDTPTVEGVVYQVSYDISGSNRLSMGYNFSASNEMAIRLSSGDTDSASYSTTTRTIITADANFSGNVAALRVDATNATGTASTRQTVGNYPVIGARGDGDFEMNGKISEFVVWNSDQSSNISGIETELNDYYAVY